jgi:uncharacterized Zn finger protein
MHDWNGYPPYVSVAEKKEKAAKKLKDLQKKRPDIKPVILTGSALARTWWGKSWNKNLEHYADYSNRIGRGRSYVRHGAVLDLRITEGAVTALVQGSTSKPYQVMIRIKPIAALQWAAMKKQCEGQLRSLSDLLMGKFSQELSEVFLAEGSGLFPAPQEISFDCNCPDWASMCKHVAAALYGIGARLDEDPLLFFTLRGVRTDDLLTEAIQGATADLLSKAAQKSARSVDDADLSSLFGIDLDSPAVFAKTSDREPNIKETPTPRKASSSARIQATIPAIKGKKRSPEPQKTIKGPRKTTKHQVQVEKELPPKSGKKSAARTTKTPMSPIEQVEAIIIRSTNGVDATTLAEKTGIAKFKIYALVQRLKQQKKVENKAHGLYVKRK